uniref:Uncharacterized protein n=1 Tax=Arundo donax TaxID=35708 RepID=A0A0A8YLE3_ARUDO
MPLFLARKKPMDLLNVRSWMKLSVQNLAPNLKKAAPVPAL